MSNFYRWRLNPTLLKKADFCKFIREHIKLFCETNCPSSPSSFVLWDTLKAYLRGQIISFRKGLSRNRRVRKRNSFQQSRDKKIYRLLVNKKLKYNMLSTHRAEKNILRTKQRYYELGEKPHKVLSWQLKAEESSRTINQIQNEAGNITHNPKEINETFKQFYINLYKSELPEDLTTKDALLSNVELPKLDQEEQENLDLPFTSKVIEKALISLQSNKSPGEDGFPPSRIL